MIDERRRKMVRIEKATAPILLMTLVILAMAIYPLPISARQGPRTEDLIINFRSTVQAAYLDLKTGVADICGHELTRDLYEDAITDPNIALAPVSAMNMYEVDINSNCTIPTYPDWRSPTSYRCMRQAGAFGIDKDMVIDTFCAGFAQRIDQPVAAPSAGWMNESMMGDDYPYNYS